MGYISGLKVVISHESVFDLRFTSRRQLSIVNIIVVPGWRGPNLKRFLTRIWFSLTNSQDAPCTRFVVQLIYLLSDGKTK